MIRVLLVQSGLPHSFWKLAAKYAIYHANRTIKSQQSKTPWELVTKEVPDASLWRPFGAKCYCHQTKDETIIKGGKLVPKGQKGILVGYAEKVSGGYELYLGKKTFVTRRHVLIVEGRSDLTITPFMEVSKQDVQVEEEAVDIAIPVATRARALAKAIDKHTYQTRSKNQLANTNNAEVTEHKIEKPICPTTINEAMNSIERL